MDFSNSFIMQKTVDWSLLNDGMTIPVSAFALLKAWDESILTHGAGKDIKVLIDYFTRSQNNDSTNIVIISSNYHRIIHKNNPHFNRHNFQFEFANGEVLRLKLYEHMKV